MSEFELDGNACGTDQVRAWKPAVPGVVEVFHARFTRYAYPSHAHQTWTLFLVDDGAIRYDLDRHPHGSDSSTVGVLPPHVVHDGRPATSDGFRKRVLYLSPAILGEELIGAAVERPVIKDQVLRRHLSAIHGVLDGADAAFEAESRLAVVLERLRQHLSGPAQVAAPPEHAGLAEQFRELLDADLAASVSLGSAGRVLGANPAHLVRTFTQRFGVPPHAYQVGRRIEIARQRLLDGQPPSDVAVGVGFYDQSHFTRHFKRYVGTTPGRYAGAKFGAN